jgi:ubiquinol-cytochrome c reductase iron-sulfur subunit
MNTPPTEQALTERPARLHETITMQPTFPLTCPSIEATTHDPDKRLWLIAASVAGGAAALTTAVPFVSTLAPSERAKAAGGPVEVDLADIPPGGARTVEWRGKPVWVVRRTAEMVAALQGHDAALVDPHSAQDQQPAYARNAARARQPEVFVAIGICTHLGCSPTSVPQGSAHPSLPADWPGGFFCPCHGSTFDGAGRVFKNKPAPTNLEVPPYRFAGATTLVIGDDAT